MSCSWRGGGAGAGPLHKSQLIDAIWGGDWAVHWQKGLSVVSAL